MKKMIIHIIFAMTSLSVLSDTSYALNDRPIIGVLSQKPSSTMVAGASKNYTSYIAASYIKFIESAGARVVPILTYQDKSYYTDIANSVNGIIFPGGSAPIMNTSGYGMAGQYLYEEVLKKNAEGIYFPLWATCLGYEMLLYLSNDYKTVLVDCAAENIALPLIPEPGVNSSKLFSEMPEFIYDIFVTENVTANFHFYCVTKEDFYANGLGTQYQVLSTSLDWDNFEFISTIEHLTLPIYGNQWHPEKNSFIWKNRTSFDSIPHFPNAIYAVQYFGNFFINEARMNDQHFASEDEEEAHLIYGYDIKYMGNTTSSFEQVYLFE